MAPSRALLGLALMLVLTQASAENPPAKLVDGALVDTQGMTLYTFDKDVAGSGKSLCNGPCATLWPPAMAGAADQPSGAFDIVVRDDGSRQWSYRGKPIYTYQADQKAGDRAGDKFKNVWHIIQP
jgi:predicted lipoprotein with Yx(FWY)xxD motif